MTEPISTQNNPNPSIASISPNAGPVGTVIKVTGAGFGGEQGHSQIGIGNVPVTPAKWSDTSIEFAVPQLPAGNHNVAANVVGANSNFLPFSVTAA